MSEDATLQDGSPAPTRETPMHQQTRNPAGGEGVNPRQDFLDDLSDKFEQRRSQELAEAVANDPGLAQKQREMDEQLARENEQHREDGLLDTDEDAAAAVQQQADANDGAANREPLHEPPAEPEKPALPAELRDDPLAEYIDMVDGRPMLRMKVDGEIVHRDLDAVRANEQKDAAADARLQYAAEWQKDLQQREANLREREAMPTQQTDVSPPPSQQDVDDLDIAGISKDLVNSMLTGSTEEATEKVTEALTQIAKRTGQPATPVDVEQIVQRAKAEARAELDADNTKKTTDEAWNDFKDEYSDVVADDEAFDFADSLTPRIEKEHPDWGPRQVMMEAGKRARDVVVKAKLAQKGEEPAPDAGRQANKQNLTPLPTARTATYEPPEQDDPNRPQSPQEAFAEIRRSRNQPT